MARFTGTTVNKIDKKGRVSVPPSFRSNLEVRVPVPPAADGQPAGFTTVVRFHVRPSADGAAIDGVTDEYLDDVQRRVDAMPMNAPERNALELREFSMTVTVQADPEGRVVIPKYLLDDAGIGEDVAFVGLGSRFQLWEPATLHSVRSAQLAANRGLTLSAAPMGAGA
jgi:MraZ protein